MIAVLKAISTWIMSVFTLLSNTPFVAGISYLDLFVFFIVLNMLISFMKSMLMSVSSDAKKTLLKGGSKVDKNLKPMKSLDRRDNE